MNDFQVAIQRAATESVANLTPSARKRGRNPAWPYVPVIEYAPTAEHPKGSQEQLLRLAFATRTEALACAAGHIERLQASTAKKLADPCQRALREYYGLPRELPKEEQP